MLITFEDRPSNSPFVERIWRSRSEYAGTFHSMATSNWVMVVTRHQGKTFLTVRGPETKATTAECPAEGEWVGIHFRVGTFMPSIPNAHIRDRNDIMLPSAFRGAFKLDGLAWEYPAFENVDVFIDRLVRRELVVMNPCVDSTLRGRFAPVSQRTEQRHFLQATGLTRATIRQIERARQAVGLLRDGVPILQVVERAGYFDQAHLTRSLKHFAGLTPSQVMAGDRQLSFLYKTEPS